MSKVLLLDSNVLIALSITDHIHHTIVTEWFDKTSPQFATCPITQGALVRFAVRHLDRGAEPARDLLRAIAEMEKHVFWPDDVDYSKLPWRQIFGYRQVTDAYLIALAEHRKGCLATVDKSLAAIFPNVLLIG